MANHHIRIRQCERCGKDFACDIRYSKTMCSKSCKEAELNEDGEYETEAYYEFRVSEMERLYAEKWLQGAKR